MTPIIYKNYLLTLPRTSIILLMMLASIITFAIGGCHHKSQNVTVKTFNITPNVQKIFVGGVVQFNLYENTNGQSPKDITKDALWSSNNHGIAMVFNDADNRGKILATGIGETEINAVINGVRSSATITVTDDVVSIKIHAVTTKIMANSSSQLTAMALLEDGTSKNVTTEVVWKSSDSKIATVSNDLKRQGMIDAISTGSVEISIDFIELDLKASITINVINQDVAYITDSINNTVLVCGLDPDGKPSKSCSVALDNTLSKPTEVAIGDAGDQQYLYVTNHESHKILVCAIGGKIDHDTCNYTAENILSPFGLAFNTINGTNYAYIASSDSGSGSIYYCKVNQIDGSLYECNKTATTILGMNSPSGIVFNTVNQIRYAYIADLGVAQDGLIYKCNVEDDGSLSTCESISDTTFSKTAGIAFDDNNKAYIINSISNTLVSCDVSTLGGLSNCAVVDTASFPLSQPTSIAMKSFNSKNYLYIANFSSNKILKCEIANPIVSCTEVVSYTPDDIVFNTEGATNIAYVTNYQSNNITRMTLDDNGDMVDSANLSNGIAKPFGIMIGQVNNKNYAYIANTDGNSVTVCNIDDQRAFANCSSVYSDTFNKPVNIILHAIDDTPFVYVVNQGAAETSGNIALCQLKQNGLLADCTIVYEGSVNPSGILLAKINNAQKAYITDYYKNAVSICSVNAAGIIDNCVDGQKTFFAPTAITFYKIKDNTYAYVTNHTTQQLSYCKIKDDGLFDSCEYVNMKFFGPFSIVFDNMYGVNYIYITNTLKNFTSCVVEQDGSLSNCIDNPSNNFKAPRGIAIL